MDMAGTVVPFDSPEELKCEDMPMTVASHSSTFDPTSSIISLDVFCDRGPGAVVVDTPVVAVGASGDDGTGGGGGDDGAAAAPNRKRNSLAKLRTTALSVGRVQVENSRLRTNRTRVLHIRGAAVSIAADDDDAYESTRAPDDDEVAATKRMAAAVLGTARSGAGGGGGGDGGGGGGAAAAAAAALATPEERGVRKLKLKGMLKTHAVAQGHGVVAARSIAMDGGLAFEDVREGRVASGCARVCTCAFVCCVCAWGCVRVRR
jgi:hypothetical protein